MNGVQLSQGYRPPLETVCFLCLSPQKLLILIWSTSEEWKADPTLKLSSGCERGTSGLKISDKNQPDVIVLKKIHTYVNVNTSQKPWPVTIAKKRIETFTNRACFNILSSRTAVDEFITNWRVSVCSKFFSFAKPPWNTSDAERIRIADAVNKVWICLLFVWKEKRKLIML